MISCFKNLVLVLLLLTPLSVWSNQRGVVIVLNAPIMDVPDFQGRIVQWARKGDILSLHESDVIIAPDLERYQLFSNVEGKLWQNFESLDLDAHQEFTPYSPSELLDRKKMVERFKIGPGVYKDREQFYRTVDRSGSTRYIPKKFVQVIYNDDREEIGKRNLTKADPTDYRLPEPIPPHYPLHHPHRYQLGFLFNYGPNNQTNYPYEAKVTKERYSSKVGGKIYYLYRTEYSDRFSIGGELKFSSQINRFQLEEGFSTEESYFTLGIGPMAWYEIFENDRILATLGGGIRLRTYFINVRLNREDDQSHQERAFQAWTAGAHVEQNFIIKKVLPYLNFHMGIELATYIPTVAIARGEISETHPWSKSSDSISLLFQGELTLLVGLHALYE